MLVVQTPLKCNWLQYLKTYFKEPSWYIGNTYETVLGFPVLVKAVLKRRLTFQHTAFIVEVSGLNLDSETMHAN
jgi:hypothetical protein